MKFWCVVYQNQNEDLFQIRDYQLHKQGFFDSLEMKFKAETPKSN